MFKWLDKKFSNTQREEATRFLDSLRGADIGVIDMISAQAIYWANFYYAEGLDLYDMEGWIMSNMMFPAQLVSNIKTLQRDGSMSNVGLQVWLHSSRALLYPELRVFGRDIWAELAKATPDARAMADEMHMQTRLLPEYLDPQKVPSGLEKLSR